MASPSNPISKPFLRPSTMYFTKNWLGCSLKRSSNKSTFILHGFEAGSAKKGAVASVFDGDEVGGGSSETGCEVVVGETALTACM